VLAFGKHKNHTYANVKAMYPDYCAWVVMTANESQDCNLGLYRFARWLQQPTSYQSEKTSKPPTKVVPKGPPPAPPAAKASASAATEPSAKQRAKKAARKAGENLSSDEDNR
jgi:hypothetical protein